MRPESVRVHIPAVVHEPQQRFRMRPESLNDYLAVIRRRWFVVLLAITLIGGTGVAVALRLPRTYAASALLEVESQEKSPVSLLPNFVQTALGGGADPVQMQTLVTRLTTVSLLERARNDYADAEPEGARLLPPLPHLAKSVHAAVETGSKLIRLSVDFREGEGGARNAALFANQLLSTFRRQLAEEETADRTLTNEIQLKLIVQKRSDLETRLDEIRRKLLGFVRREGTPTLWSAELSQLLQRQQLLLTERRLSVLRKQGAVARQELASQQLPDEPGFVEAARTESVNPLRTHILEELVTSEALSAQKGGENLAEGSWERKGLAAAQSHLKDALNDVPETLTSQTFGLNARRERLLEETFQSQVAQKQVEQEISSLDDLLRRAESELRTRAARLPESEIQLATLQRRLESLVKVYDELLLQQGAVELALGEVTERESSGGRRIGGMVLLDPARPELRPIRPRLKFIALSSLVLGLLVGMAAAFVAEFGRQEEG